MEITDAQAMTGIQVDDKAFLAFERKSNQPGITGIYFLEFDRRNGTVIADPDAALVAAPKVIDAVADYNNRDVDRIFLYANKAGTEVTITFITIPDQNNTTFIYTGRIVNSAYTPCSAPAQIQANWKNTFGFYYDDNTKNKFMLFDNGRILAEAH